MTVKGGSFRDNVMDQVRHLGTSIPKMAKQMGVPYNSLRSWIASGKVPASKEKSLAEAIGVDTSTLQKWGLEYCQTKIYPEKRDELRLTGEELELLVQMQKLIGDLSFKTIADIIGEYRKNKQKGP